MSQGNKRWGFTEYRWCNYRTSSQRGLIRITRFHLEYNVTRCASFSFVFSSVPFSWRIARRPASRRLSCTLAEFMRLYILFRSSCFQRWNILKDGNLCRLKIAIIRVTFMYFFFNSKIRILMWNIDCIDSWSPTFLHRLISTSNISVDKIWSNPLCLSPGYRFHFLFPLEKNSTRSKFHYKSNKQ